MLLLWVHLVTSVKPAKNDTTPKGPSVELWRVIKGLVDELPKPSCIILPYA